MLNTNRILLLAGYNIGQLENIGILTEIQMKLEKIDIHFYECFGRIFSNKNFEKFYLNYDKRIRRI